MLLAAGVLAGADPQAKDDPAPGFRLGKVPAVTLAPRAAATEEQTKQIQALIGRLAEVEQPYFGLSPTLTGSAFAPLLGQHPAGPFLLTGRQLQSAEALRRLVEIGPEALPHLLDALADATPTKLKVDREGASGGIGFG